MFVQAKKEMLDVLENNILNFWLKMQDLENRGFYGQMRGDGTLVKDANKGGILNARILWSFSACYRVLSEKRGELGIPQERLVQYLTAATRAKDYILEHFIDKEYGGIYWELDYKGNPVDTKKQFYALGFAIYGLSEYTRATGDAEALRYAIQLFRTIEEHSLDKENNGYIEACTREWGEISDMRLSDLDENYPKSQNTHLHIIEPYANLFRCLNELENRGIDMNSDYGTCEGTLRSVKAELEAALRNIIGIFCDKILNPETHHLDLFFENNWSRGAGQLESYGHDIECSWLMHEAALVLGDRDVLNKVEGIIKLVAVASEKGINEDGSMTHEANVDTGHVDADRHWWVQAENVVGWANLYQHFADESAAEKSLKCWQYIKENLIDWEGGEWFWSRDPMRNINRKDDKAGFWKCPYHNSRMCLEIIERF